MNIGTGERKLIQDNPGVAGYMTDDDFNVRFAMQLHPRRRHELL